MSRRVSDPRTCLGRTGERRRHTAHVAPEGSASCSGGACFCRAAIPDLACSNHRKSGAWLMPSFSCPLKTAASSEHRCGSLQQTCSPPGKRCLGRLGTGGSLRLVSWRASRVQGRNLSLQSPQCHPPVLRGCRSDVRHQSLRSRPRRQRRKCIFLNAKPGAKWTRTMRERLPAWLRYYLDVHIPRSVTVGLRTRGVDVGTA